VSKLDRVVRRASEVPSLLDLPDIRVVFADTPNAGQLQMGIRLIKEASGRTLDDYKWDGS
jgi:hypothetical protein